MHTFMSNANRYCSPAFRGRSSGPVDGTGGRLLAVGFGDSATGVEESVAVMGKRFR
jgi:hypothetical protein